MGDDGTVGALNVMLGGDSTQFDAMFDRAEKLIAQTMQDITKWNANAVKTVTNAVQEASTQTKEWAQKSGSAVVSATKNIGTHVQQATSSIGAWRTQVMERATLEFYRLGYAMDDASKWLGNIHQKVLAVGEPIRDAGVQLSIAGAALTATLSYAAKSYGNVSENLGNMAVRTGIAASALSEFEYVTAVSGTSIGQFEHALRRMQRSIADAASGSERSEKLMQRYGISLAALKGMAPEAQFGALAEAISKIPDPTQKASLSMQIFGRESTRMLTMMEGGAKGIEELRKQARLLGYGLSNEDVKAGKEFNDALQAMELGLQRVYYTIGSQIAPVLRKYADWVQNNVRSLKVWAQENGNLLRTVFYLGGTLTIVGGTLATFGAGLVAVATAARALGVAMTYLNLTFLSLAKQVAVVSIVATSVLSLADAFTTMTGVANLGIRDLFLNIRIGGAQLRTWINTMWLDIFKGWEHVRLWIIEGWEGLKLSVLTIGNYIYRGMLTVAKGIADAFWGSVQSIAAAYDWLKNKASGMTFGMVGQGEAEQSIMSLRANSNQFYGDILGDARSADEERWKQFHKESTQRRKESEATIANYNEAIAKGFRDDTARFGLDAGPAAASPASFGAPSPGAAGEGMRASYQQMNLARFALPTSATAPNAFQQVRAPVMEEKLDEMIKIMRRNQPAVLAP
jgi:hypothetical protein